MFAGLKLGIGPGIGKGIGTVGSKAPKGNGVLAQDAKLLSPFEQAVDRYARACDAIERQKDRDLPVLMGHTREMLAATQALDKVEPGSVDLLRSAVKHDRRMAQALKQMTGRARSSQLVAGIHQERAALADPAVRADRFVKQWQELKIQPHGLSDRETLQAEDTIQSQKASLLQALAKDTEVDAILRDRKAELGIRQSTPQPKPGPVAEKPERGPVRSRGPSFDFGL
ncbi:hypothetical protein IFT84_11310 [Rhizobium sp. CFBP 8762]|uniref:hypothetical protein n=1 Tax=Rhizobium sp. CFBP 8762 TaxID=2775279 RepID=UPI0017805098|nr:hypothetical protein [Rhizobium sp. CFBP 8762]MBD8555113.1 hypothetical protein [Rhizobium sp. CFBP 8762]